MYKYKSAQIIRIYLHNIYAHLYKHVRGISNTKALIGREKLKHLKRNFRARSNSHKNTNNKHYSQNQLEEEKEQNWRQKHTDILTHTLQKRLLRENKVSVAI